jgi:peptide deformylase
MSNYKSEINPDQLKLVLYPHEALTTIGSPVLFSVEGDLIFRAAKRMIQVLESLRPRGIGLAANQVGLTRKLFVCVSNLDAPQDDQIIQAYINPKILNESGACEDVEGCLSLPGISGVISRSESVEMAYLDLEGVEHTVKASGLQARCFLHEIDHLDAICIIDKFNERDRKRNQIALKKLVKNYSGKNNVPVLRSVS